MRSAVDYPVHYAVDRPARFTRLQLGLRVMAFFALGIVGLSFGSVFWLGYLALPVFAAIRLAPRAAGAYLDVDAPRIVRVLHWFAAISAWLGLVSDRLPDKTPAETVELAVQPRGRPTARNAVWRLLAGIPSALVLSLLGVMGMFVWLWAALSILIHERVGAGAFDFLVGLQRWSIRLLAYQASLVDEYPPFSFSDGGARAGLHPAAS
jgi:hypothetical protein